MAMFWSPDEPNVLRFPKPEAGEYYEVEDNFKGPAGEVILVDGVKTATQNEQKLEDILAEEAARGH